ncbi:MAG: glycerol kinase GlpK [Oligoflexales bacterium]|nr:glycerol kinase GlpK [Oligoflexales bacterium]
MQGNYLLSIDQGTTGTTVLVLDTQKSGKELVCAQATIDFEQYYPQAGWVEHNLDEIWASVQKAASRALAIARQEDPNFHPSKISAIGITNQRETLCFFDRKSGQALRKAIVWQCKRSTAICDQIKLNGQESELREKTGLLADPYFSGSKLRWVCENEPEVKNKLTSGQGVCGTIDTYLIHRLTQGESFVTEASNASRTLLYNIHRACWDQELLELFSVPSESCLAELKDSACLLGKTKGTGFLPDGIPISSALGDQQAALAGQTCFEQGEAKCTYGTGAFLLLQLGKNPIPSQNNLLTAVSWSLNGSLSYAFEGSSFIAGAAVQYLRDNLSLLERAADAEYLASDVIGAPEIYFVPALAGLGAPWWNPNARGAFFGLTRGTNKNQLVRAALEGMAFQVCDLLDSMAKDSDHALKILRVDGGASANNLLMQVQANLGNIVVERPRNLETTALGAAFFAALGVGIYSSLDELKKLRTVDSVYNPVVNSQEEQKRQEQLAGWKRAIKAVEVFASHDT